MELRPPVRGIFFDLGWTLLYPPSGDWMFSGFARKYFPRDKLSALPRERVDAAREEGMELLNRNHLMSSTDEEYRQFYEYYALLAKALPELGLTQTDLEKVTEDKVHTIRDNYRLFPDTIDTLEALSGKYRLGVISDTWPSIVPVLENFGILSYFSCVTYSSTLRTYHPDPRMYRDALEKMGLPPEETVFVDDGVENLQGARELGIQPVLIRAKPEAEFCDNIPSIRRISGLLELLP